MTHGAGNASGITAYLGVRSGEGNGDSKLTAAPLFGCPGLRLLGVSAGATERGVADSRVASGELKAPSTARRQIWTATKSGNRKHHTFPTHSTCSTYCADYIHYRVTSDNMSNAADRLSQLPQRDI